MLFPVTVNSAYRGYSWSRIPDGATGEQLDELLRIATDQRGDFPEPGRIDRGIAICRGLAVAYSIQSASAWDSEGRASEYTAFALFNPAEAAAIDFGRLLGHPFFITASRPAATGTVTKLEFESSPAVDPPLTAAGNLLCHQKFENLPAASAGKLIATYHTRSPLWLFRLNTTTLSTVPHPSYLFTVTCSPWQK